jgi:hypothetical protein
VTQSRHSFVVTVHEDRVAVVEDVQTGARARVDDLACVGAQIGAWLTDRPPVPGTEQRPAAAADRRRTRP